MVKEKTKTIRTYDQDGFIRRAACLCFKDKTEQEVLLVSSSRHRDKWIVPGGGVEPAEDPGIAAVREVLEEAGVRGTLGRFIGRFEHASIYHRIRPQVNYPDFKNKGKKHRTSVFAFIVTELLEEWEDKRNIGRRRKWFSIVEAKEHLQHKPVQVSYLELLANR